MVPMLTFQQSIQIVFAAFRRVALIAWVICHVVDGRVILRLCTWQRRNLSSSRTCAQRAQ